MAVRWKIPFRSMRSNTLYTVNVYDEAYSGTPVELQGAAQPFTTDEDNDEDFFAPVRTQTGYLRIVDTGEDADGRPFDYRDMLPATDTDRPVTLTDEEGTTLWQGYIQAQNFGSRLYEQPQVRELPVQCVLTVLGRLDMEIPAVSPCNVAYLLYSVLYGGHPQNVESIVIQGGADAQQWLLLRVDCQLFLELNKDGEAEPRFTRYDVLEQLCTYFGWTARTHRQTLYLTCPDDGDEQELLTLTREDLLVMGVSDYVTGTVGGQMGTIVLGDVLAGTDNTDTQVRGMSKATVTADVGTADNAVIQAFPDSVVKKMYGIGLFLPAANNWRCNYTETISQAETPLMKATAEGNVAFCLRENRFTDADSEDRLLSVVSFKTSYDGKTCASFRTKFVHSFHDGYITIKARIYREETEPYSDMNENGIGQKTMHMRLGIGMTRESAVWWAGTGWTAGETMFRALVGSNESELRFIPATGDLPRNASNRIPTTGENRSQRPPVSDPRYGYLFLDLLGSADVGDDNHWIDVADLSVDFERAIPRYKLIDRERKSTEAYTAGQRSSLYDEWATDTVFATENYSRFGYGVLLNTDGTYFTGFSYKDREQQPEQHLADRVAAYWKQSRRKIDCELQTQLVEGEITPATLTVIDGTTMYPVAVGHDWWDDVTTLTAMEL